MCNRFDALSDYLRACGYPAIHAEKVSKLLDEHMPAGYAADDLWCVLKERERLMYRAGLSEAETQQECARVGQLLMFPPPRDVAQDRRSQ